MPKHGDLRVWWIPQVPGNPFHVEVRTLSEARVILDTLARYDQFQFEHDIKLNFCNSGGLVVFDVSDKTDSVDGSWTDWHDNEGLDFDDLGDSDIEFAVWEGAQVPEGEKTSG